MSTENFSSPSARAQSQAPTYTYFPKITPGRVDGDISRFREASVTLTQTGIQLDGRVVLPTAKQVLFIVLGLVTGIGALLVAMILEYGVRLPANESLPWSSIEKIVLVPTKSRACIVYRNPDNPMKFLSLAFQLRPDDYSSFVQAANYFGKERVQEGKIKPTVSTWLLVVLGTLLLFIFGIIIWVSIQPRPIPD